VQTRVFGFVDDAHTPAAKFLDDVIVGNVLGVHSRARQEEDKERTGDKSTKGEPFVRRMWRDGVWARNVSFEK